MLTLDQMIDLLEGRISRANAHWSFLFAINLAVVGWVLTSGEGIVQPSIYVFIALLFLVYIFIFIAILQVQTEMIALELDIAMEVKGKDHQSCFLETLEKPKFKNVKKITWIVYWLGNILVLGYLGLYYR